VPTPKLQRKQQISRYRRSLIPDGGSAVGWVQPIVFNANTSALSIFLLTKTISAKKFMRQGCLKLPVMMKAGNSTSDHDGLHPSYKM
jgi:hypothetical protein